GGHFLAQGSDSRSEGYGAFENLARHRTGGLMAFVACLTWGRRDRSSCQHEESRYHKFGQSAHFFSDSQFLQLLADEAEEFSDFRDFDAANIVPRIQAASLNHGLFYGETNRVSSRGWWRPGVAP